jgi:integrase
VGLTKRGDGYYVEFTVIDTGKGLSLAPSGTGKIKRWKVGTGNKIHAKNQEAIIKTRLLSGQEPSPSMARARSMTFRQWAKIYLDLEEVKKITTYEDRKLKVRHLVDFFGDKPLAEITPEDVAMYREQRRQYKRIPCPRCTKMVTRAACAKCGWERTDKPIPVSLQTINHDHTALTHMLNIAKSPRFKFIVENPASHVPKPDPKNERDRVASSDEWHRWKAVAAPHIRRFMTIAYFVGPRRGELLKLEWPDVDLRRKEFTLRKTKNGETRVVPMTPEVYEVFRELWKERRLDTPGVFLYKGKPMKNIRTAFAAACRRAGITNLRVHDFRHTASTNLRRAGVDTMTAMKIVGHKSEQMHRRYNTIQPADLHAAAAKLHKYSTVNTLITLDEIRPTGQTASDCNSNVGA